MDEMEEWMKWRNGGMDEVVVWTAVLLFTNGTTLLYKQQESKQIRYPTHTPFIDYIKTALAYPTSLAPF